MMNTLLAIIFSLSSNVGTDLVQNAIAQPQAEVEAVSREEAQSLYDLMEKNRQRIFAHLGDPADQSVSPEEAQALYASMEENRRNIFDRIGQKAEQAAMAGLVVPFSGDEAVYVSAAE